MDSNKLLPWGLKLSTVALSLPVNTRYASCIALAITGGEARARYRSEPRERSDLGEEPVKRNTCDVI